MKLLDHLKTTLEERDPILSEPENMACGTYKHGFHKGYRRAIMEIIDYLGELPESYDSVVSAISEWNKGGHYTNLLDVLNKI
jgi:hypothetical protein